MICVCENKMVYNIDGKLLYKIIVFWFDFLFDKIGDLLKKYLENVFVG